MFYVENSEQYLGYIQIEAKIPRRRQVLAKWHKKISDIVYQLLLHNPNWISHCVIVTSYG